MPTIWAKVTHRFSSLHRWPDATPPVHYLSHPHRHLFHITLWVEQHHDDRDVEYLQLKDDLIAFCSSHFPENIGSTSCEMIALQILNYLSSHTLPNRRMRCEVLEDGENGALVET